MRKAIVLLLTFAVLLASFAFVGGVSADENAPHMCVYTNAVAGPGVAGTVDYYDVNGELLFTFTLDNLNGTDFLANEQQVAYLPIVSGTVYITVTATGFGTFSYTLPANFLGNGECFDDFRLNSRPDRDLAAPVAIYVRFADFGDGFNGYDVYGINQYAGTGTLSLRVTEDELNDAYNQARETGANVTVAQDGDILFTMLGASTETEGWCQVNAIDQEGKIYEYGWVCLS